MKRIFVVIALVTLLGSITSTTVLAAASGPPDVDTYVNINAPTTSYGTSDNLWARGDTVSCTTALRTYLRWDVTDIPGGTGVVNTATLSLFVNGSTGDFTSPRSVTLYKVADDNWGNDMTWNTSPAVGDAIQTIDVSDPSGGISNVTISFDAPALASYLEAEANGDNLASFAVVMTGNCTAGSVGLRFDSIDKPSGTPPDLQALDPNAVTLRTMDAETGGFSITPLLLGGFALLLVAAGAGLLWTRRNQAAS